ncbi:MAG: hypothetical protein P4L83_17865 [Nevskia sp.]|nr:hypothetical protein [Nevskia sp.]
MAADSSGAPAAAAATHEGFLVHAGFRYFKLATLLCVAAIVAYCWHSPPEGPNGGTWLGYALGTIGALLIVWLTFLGWRKRRYTSNLGTVRGWASAHVYLGLALITIATLHTGFHFGWNVHTLAYALMLGVILSGIYGIVAYARYPELITANRGQGTREVWLSEIDEINDQSLKLADALDPQVHQVVVRSVDRVRIGGGLRALLFGPREPERKSFDRISKELSETTSFMATQIRPERKAPKLKNEPDMQSTVMFMASQLAGGTHDSENVQKLLDLIARRRDLTARINRDIQLHARMQVWLFIHVPLTFGLLAALTAHILSVFLYW